MRCELCGKAVANSTGPTCNHSDFSVSHGVNIGGDGHKVANAARLWRAKSTRRAYKITERTELKGYVAPVVSALVITGFAAAYAIFFFLILDGIGVVGVVKWVVTAGALFVIGGMAAAVVSRIRELRGGIEDDIGKY